MQIPLEGAKSIKHKMCPFCKKLPKFIYNPKNKGLYIKVRCGCGYAEDTGWFGFEGTAKARWEFRLELAKGRIRGLKWPKRYIENKRWPRKDNKEYRVVRMIHQPRSLWQSDDDLWKELFSENTIEG